jgi:predicted PurR-regulated permease PerM
VISTVDNIIKPYLISDRGAINPAIVIMGVFGGIWLLGPIGIFAGPLFLVLFLEIILLFFYRQKVV